MDPAAFWVAAADELDGGGGAGEEDGGGIAGATVAEIGGGARDPHEIAAGV